MEGIVNNIIPMSLVDGPGNRTAIFFQGCNFNCMYCHNPETIHHCIHKGDCISYCPSGALKMEGTEVKWDREKCVDCDRCIEACPIGASPKITHYTVQDLVKEVEANIPFIEGVSTSGGECTLQYEFLAEFFKEIHKLGLTTLVDTNGSLDLSKNIFQDFVKETDGFMLDIKAWNQEEHIRLTGQKNHIVKKNLKYLFEIGKLEEVRCVCLDTLDNKETIRGIVETLGQEFSLRPPKLKIISYRKFGVREEFQFLRPPSTEEMNSIKDYAEYLGFKEIIQI